MKDWTESQKKFLEYMLGGETDAAIQLAKDSLAQGAKPTEFFEGCVSPSLKIIGQKFIFQFN